jgi:hypothetical protein
VMLDVLPTIVGGPKSRGARGAQPLPGGGPEERALHRARAARACSRWCCSRRRER